jgi:glucose/arabinose dehydrogenase
MRVKSIYQLLGASFCLLIIFYGVRQIATGLTQPVFITNAEDGSERLFIVESAGRIRIVKNGALLSTAYLDIQSIVNSTGSEQGLLALAFHPNYESNGRFYTVHTIQDGPLVLSSFTRSLVNPDLADANSRVTLLTIAHPTNQNHNGGTLAFGPDGYLYWSTGDGGGSGNPSNNAQNLNSLLGKILRIDIDSASPYSVPASNPFFNNPSPSVRKEIWAYGLRNPLSRPFIPSHARPIFL